MSHSPRNEKRPGKGACSDQGSQVSNPADPIVDEARELRKRTKAAATCGAKLALAGAQLFESGAGTFTVAVGGYLRHFGDINALQAFVSDLEGGRK